MAKKAEQKERKSKRLGKRTKRCDADKPKPWPYEAGRDRDQAAEEANVIVKLAEDALELTNDPVILKKLGKIVASGSVVLRLLERQGAKTRPMER